MFTINFNNGLILENLTLSGSWLYTDKVLTESDFKGMNPVTIVTEYGESLHSHMYLKNVERTEAGSKFSIDDLSQAQIQDLETFEKMDATDAQSTYTAIMTNTLMEA